MKHFRLLVIYAISSAVYIPFAQWVTTTRVGTMLFPLGTFVYALPLGLILLASPLLVIGLFIPRKRRVSLSLLLFGVLLTLCCAAGMAIGQKTRRAGMEAFARRSQPLITAINKYEQDHAAPVSTLNDLVPAHLSSVPTTGMGAYPHYRYHVGDEARLSYGDNPWALTVFTPNGLINFDMLLYLPKQNYPDHGYGGTLERIGEWAYVHE